ncbi:hypothetical protein TanjilG_04992 [Lupinus angustifolius]|uniref:Uncharacterized protein n=1 Tax=Lupinus angustifolius TaxID=3871 RepID=A0A4P1R501_LUPAN|nr:hypothetical protein TanjilG_04992 [Lupinus angustifolius]
MERIFEIVNANVEDAQTFFDSTNTASLSNIFNQLGLPYNGNFEDLTENNNQAHTTESATNENPVLPPLILDDPNPLPGSPNSSDPLANEAEQDYSSSMVALFSEGAAYQGQNENSQMKIQNSLYDPTLGNSGST